MSYSLHLPILGLHQTLSPSFQELSLSSHLLPFKEAGGEARHGEEGRSKGMLGHVGVHYEADTEFIHDLKTSLWI